MHLSIKEHVLLSLYCYYVYDFYALVCFTLLFISSNGQCNVFLFM